MEAATSHNSALILTAAIDYGAQDDLAMAARTVARKVACGELAEDEVGAHLLAPAALHVHAIHHRPPRACQPRQQLGASRLPQQCSDPATHATAWRAGRCPLPWAASCHCRTLPQRRLAAGGSSCNRVLTLLILPGVVCLAGHA
jgi:hypothetical protein